MSAETGSRRGVLAIVLIALLAALLGGAAVYAYQKVATERAQLAAQLAQRAGAAVATQTAGTGGSSSTQASEQPAGGSSGKSGSSGEAKPPASSATEKQIAYITRMTDSGESNFELTADYVQFLTGKAAADAYKADGKGELDGDFYIRNENTKLRTFPLSSGAKLFLLGWEGASVTDKSQVPADVFQSQVTHAGQYKDAPYTLTIQDGKIVRAEQMYLP